MKMGEHKKYEEMKRVITRRKSFWASGSPGEKAAEVFIGLKKGDFFVALFIKSRCAKLLL